MADVRATADYGRTAGMFGFISAGLLVVLLILTFAGGTPPALDASAKEVAKYYSDNEGLSKLGSIVGFLVLGTVPVFFLGVYSVLRDRGPRAGDAWPRLALVAFIVTGALVAAQGSSALAISLGIDDEFGGSPAVAAALFDLYNALGAAIAIVFTVFFAATGIALARTAAYPKWWSQLLYVGAVTSFVSFFAVFTELDVLAFIGLIPFVIFIVWIAAASGALLRGAPTTTTGPAM